MTSASPGPTASPASTATHALPPLALIDVDSDRELQRRYGLKIPVLLVDQVPGCSGRLDQAELLRVLADRHDAA